ncbi:hypothetical protein DFJ58DRAFT_911671 [Suillus subalutaceus]|uniref:uncharacterized protein n=1 Tax=Suillus subalutaceus TaxID=48586 RepID=UPI001B860001|nr:uncharacterized protein DFJ58DRAFT_911671 [Suillus subalutaceus]KAG1867249.1 hypothetical protein DFJ58DRAFT_911671 [Suillus subalutaceus]
MPAKAPSKKGGKTALLKAQESLRAEMVSTAGRTASGRQRRPTEKETYRILKARRGEERQQALETKMKKRDLKALRTTYRTHPEVFDSEPAGLLSDADRDEDNMFSDLQCTYKTGTHIQSSTNDSDTWTTTTLRTSLIVAADNTPDDHDEVDEAFVGTKHKLEDSEVLDTDMNFNKGPLPTVKGQRFAPSHQGFAQPLPRLSTCCLVVTRAPFPETLIIETKLAKDAWREACNMAELTIQLTPSLVKMMTRCTSQVRGELKTKMRTLTALFFGFRASRSIPAIKQNRDLAESLKEGSQPGLIQEAMNHMWFANRCDEGIVHAKYFDPLPVQTIALILTAIECCIDEWMTGLKEDIKFSSLAYSPGLPSPSRLPAAVRRADCCLQTAR